MAILRSNDGKFYDIADEQLDERLIPAEEVKARLDEAGVAPPSRPTGPSPKPGPAPEMAIPGTGGQVVIQIFPSGDAGPIEGAAPAEQAPEEGSIRGDVEAHGYCWRRNCFRNYWRRNCWRNSCR
ncbi:MAG: hypothetical protein AAF236_11380 [Verrucomicrobiota bacterium]